MVYRAADVTLIASLAGDLNADDFVGIDELTHRAWQQDGRHADDNPRQHPQTWYRSADEGGPAGIDGPMGLKTAHFTSYSFP